MLRRHGGATVRTAVCPFAAWALYFPDKPYDPGEPVAALVPRFVRYFNNFVDVLCKSDTDVQVDFGELVEHCGVDNLAGTLRDEPTTTLNAIALAVHEVMLTVPATGPTIVAPQPASDGPTMPGSSRNATAAKLHVALSNFEPLTPLRDLKASLISKFVGIRGTVVRVGNVRPLVIAGDFLCTHCGAAQVVNFPDGKYLPPTSCPGASCKSRSFELLRDSANTKSIDWQKIRIQEQSDDDAKDTGRIPRSIEVELTNTLVDTCVPGDVITVAGIVKVITTEDGGRNKERRTMYLLYIEANSLTNAKASDKTMMAGSATNLDMVQYSAKDLYLIDEIQKQPDLFRLLVHSISPGIYGHEIVKAGLVLALFGGRRRYSDDRNRVAVRGDPHCLIVGDPGMGKSQMLSSVSAIAPRGVYVCGNSATSAGLTVTLHKDKDTGDQTLEAGALVLADQGVCCIDEFDKMAADHDALLEAMEQQSISIAKAGVCCTLPTRTSVIAAANPCGGHYNKAKTVAENLKMGGALLSRFDLIFILMDKPNQRMDQFLSEHVMAMHSNRQANTDIFCSTGQPDQGSAVPFTPSLEERLKLRRGEKLDIIPANLLRTYVSYARKYVQPTMSPRAADVLQQFYLELRQKHRSVDGTPVTTRQLESAIRLAEARARVELRETVTEEDAKDVVEIMRQSLFETEGNDESTFTDIDYSHIADPRTGMSKMAQAKRMVAELQRLAETHGNNLFTFQQLHRLSLDLQLRVANFEDFVEMLNQQGFLLKRGNQVYKVQTAI